MIKETITVINQLGLHARAAAKFVTHANHYTSHIDVIKDNKRVNAKSIMGIMMLAASCGTELTLEIEGDDEKEALSDLKALINDRFGEAE